MGVANVPAASAGGGLEPYYQKFTSSGTFTLPSGYGAAKPLLVNIQVIGGGGGGSPYAANITGNADTATGGYNQYFGSGATTTINYNAVNFTFNGTNNQNGAGGGSGGLAQTQMYLTSNLTITVGAAGARPTVKTQTAKLINNSNRASNDTVPQTWYWDGTDNGLTVITMNTPGGSGGTSTAGSVSASGGSGATAGNLDYSCQVTTNAGRTGLTGTTNGVTPVYTGNTINSSTNAGGGSPSGTAGSATPLLGTIAGGSGTSTAVFGSYGIGGIKTDGATSTGVEGTGGGFGSIGASGAVILTWWE